jgi:hypothetical protein
MAQGGENDIIELLAEDSDLNPIRDSAVLASAFQEIVSVAKKRVNRTDAAESSRNGELNPER